MYKVMQTFSKRTILGLAHVSRHIWKQFYISWNRIMFRLLGIRFGKNMRVFPKCYLGLGPRSRITIGDNFTFYSGDGWNHLARNLRGCFFAENNAVVTIGDNVGISSSSIRAKRSITIGNNVDIGADSLIIDTDAHSLDYMDRRSSDIDHANAKSSPIVIGDDVLIGTRCVILKGVTIGARSIIGAGSVVSRSIPSDCIAAGNPCKVIKQLKTIINPGVGKHSRCFLYSSQKVA